MEPNKTIEHDFKQKLEQRTIQPTEMAWDRLDAMLSVAEGKKTPNRSWMYMAASFLALLLVGALYLSQQKRNTTNGIDNNTNNVATTPDAPKASETEKGTNVVPQAGNVTEEAVATNTTPAAVHSSQSNMVANNKRVITVKNTDNTPIVISNESVAVNNTVTTNAEVAAQSTKIKVDANELLASVDSPKLNSPKIKNAGVKVNANSLLSSVEGEINDSFKDNALQGVVKNFNVVKSAVVNRNRQ